MNTTSNKDLGSVTGCANTPTMHPDYAIGTRVRAQFGPDWPSFTGTITGVASVHVLFHYIITLDAPLVDARYKGWTTISVSGCSLTPL